LTGDAVLALIEISYAHVYSGSAIIIARLYRSGVTSTGFGSLSKVTKLSFSSQIKHYDL